MNKALVHVVQLAFECPAKDGCRDGPALADSLQCALPDAVIYARNADEHGGPQGRNV